MIPGVRSDGVQSPWQPYTTTPTLVLWQHGLIYLIIFCWACKPIPPTSYIHIFLYSMNCAHTFFALDELYSHYYNCGLSILFILIWTSRRVCTAGGFWRKFRYFYAIEMTTLLSWWWIKVRGSFILLGNKRMTSFLRLLTSDFIYAMIYAVTVHDCAWEWFHDWMTRGVHIMVYRWMQRRHLVAAWTSFSVVQI